MYYLLGIFQSSGGFGGGGGGGGGGVKGVQMHPLWRHITRTRTYSVLLHNSSPCTNHDVVFLLPLCQQHSRARQQCLTYQLSKCDGNSDSIHLKVFKQS